MQDIEEWDCGSACLVTCRKMEFFLLIEITQETEEWDCSSRPSRPSVQGALSLNRPISRCSQTTKFDLDIGLTLSPRHHCGSCGTESNCEVSWCVSSMLAETDYSVRALTIDLGCRWVENTAPIHDVSLLSTVTLNKSKNLLFI